MSSRTLRCLLLLVTIAALTLALIPAAGQSTPAATEPVWEYRVVNPDPNRCASAEAMTTILNANGRQGWELVGYMAGPPQFPETLEGSIAMRSAVPNGRNDLYPQLVDSYQGTISLKMPQAQAGACQLIFKRKVVAAHP
jgi:hypothetical protein